MLLIGVEYNTWVGFFTTERVGANIIPGILVLITSSRAEYHTPSQLLLILVYYVP